jgi:hypothetical protein
VCKELVFKVKAKSQNKSEFPDGKIPYYKNYGDGYYTSQAIYSFLSYLQSIQLDLNKSWLLIKQL